MNTHEECTTLGTEINSQHLKGYMYWFVIAGFLFYCVKINKYQGNVQESWENPGRSIFGNFQNILSKKCHTDIWKNAIGLIR